MKNFDWNRHVKEALDRTEFMVVASQGREGLWVCPVEFAYDSKLDLYAVSMLRSRHMQYFGENPDVAVSIFSTKRFPDGAVSGLQLKGVVKMCETQQEAEEAVRYIYKRRGKEVDAAVKAKDRLGPDALWNYFKITPTEAWLFNSQLFDEEKQGRKEIPLAFLSLN